MLQTTQYENKLTAKFFQHTAKCNKTNGNGQAGHPLQGATCGEITQGVLCCGGLLGEGGRTEVWRRDVDRSYSGNFAPPWGTGRGTVRGCTVGDVQGSCSEICTTGGYVWGAQWGCPAGKLCGGLTQWERAALQERRDSHTAGVTQWVCLTVRDWLPTKTFPRRQQKNPAHLSLHLGPVKISSLFRADCSFMHYLFRNSLHLTWQTFSSTEVDQSEDKDEDEE